MGDDTVDVMWKVMDRMILKLSFLDVIVTEEQSTHDDLVDEAAVRRVVTRVDRTNAKIGQATHLGVDDRTSLTIKEKVQKWNEDNVKVVIRDKLYPLAKIVFNSAEELQYGGDICNVIMANVKFDDNYDHFTTTQKDLHRREMWIVWSTLVCKGLDSKRHNQKAGMRKVFWGKWIGA